MVGLASAVVVCVAVLALAAYTAGLLASRRAAPLRAAVSARLRPAQPASQPVRRSIEDISADLLRTGARFHTLGPGASYVRVQAIGGAYDRVLGECSDTLSVTHLLTVLPPGPDLDAERGRVETVLGSYGIDVPRAAR